MSAQIFHRKPEKRRADRGIIAAQYHAGQPLNDLWVVAHKADTLFHGPLGRVTLAECVMPDETVLVIRWMRVPDDYPAKVEYKVVKDGDWLYYDERYGSLGRETTREIERWYEPVVHAD